jgi:hypothetical protein
MASLDQLKTALVNAHNAGDTQAATVLASAIMKMQPATMKSEADAVGPFEAGLIGAGRGTDKVIQGVRQLWNKATGDQATLDQMAGDEAEKDRLYKPLQEARPLATAIGEAAPALAVPVGAASGLGMVAKSAAANALPGLLGYGSGEDRMKAGAIGAAGGAVGSTIGLGAARLLKPATGALSSESAGAAERLGLKLSAGQKTGNPALQNFENYLSRSPGSSGAMLKANAANQTALDSAAARAMGQNADGLGEDVFRVAKDSIGSEFQRLQGITKPQLGNDFLQALVQIDSANVARGSFKSKEVDSLITKGLDLAAKGNLSGTAYKEIRTELSNEANKAFRAGDATVGQAYKALRKSLDDAAEKSLPAAERKAWAETRKQWSAYKALSKSNVSEGGHVSAPRLASAMRSANGDAVRTGSLTGETADIARIGEAVKGVQNPNSGLLVNQLMYSNPVTALPMMAANKTAQAAYSSPIVQKYLAEGLLEIGPNGRLIMGRAATPLGAPVAQQFLGAQ